MTGNDIGFITIHDVHGNGIAINVKEIAIVRPAALAMDVSDHINLLAERYVKGGEPSPSESMGPRRRCEIVTRSSGTVVADCTVEEVMDMLKGPGC